MYEYRVIEANTREMRRVGRAQGRQSPQVGPSGRRLLDEAASPALEEQLNALAAEGFKLHSTITDMRGDVAILIMERHTPERGEISIDTRAQT